MIVNLQENGWEIIYHRAHALLAAQIAGACQQKNDSLRIVDTIAAISHHDDLEKEWEDDQLTSAGAPMDFTLERQTPIKKLCQHIEDSLYRGRWVALLTSMHLCFLNQGSKDQPEIKEFLAEQRKLQTQWRKELDLSQEQADSAYQFMKWCDRLSLILCQRKLPDNERALEINQGADGKIYYVTQSDEGWLTVSPWCFAQDMFTVKVEASYLSQIKFADNQSLTEALKAAPRKYLEWRFFKTRIDQENGKHKPKIFLKAAYVGGRD